MLKVKVFSIKGSKLADFALPKEYEIEVNLNLLAQAKRVYEDNFHFGLRKAKTRSEVIRTKKKLYKQKGTGGARHGSKNAPIFVGGGVAHGPRPLDRVLVLPKKLKVRALAMAVSGKAREGQMVLVEGADKVTKTKDAFALLTKISEEVKGKKFVYVSSVENETSVKFFRNIEGTNTATFDKLNAYTVLTGGVLVVDKNVFEKKEAAKKKEVKKVVKETAKKTIKK